MKQARSSRAAVALTPAFLLGINATATAQEPDTSVETRLQRLEQALRREHLGVRAEEATSRASWVSVDTAGIPDLQDKPKATAVESTVDLKFWGRVNFAASYDNFQGTGGIGGTDFNNYITSQGNEELNFNPRDTRFGFAASNAFDDWIGRAVVEIDFYGSNAGANLLPRMRLGYVELGNQVGFSLRAGQDWVPIAQQNPGTIDFGILSWSGNLWNRVPQVTARYKSGGIEGLIGVMHQRVGGLQDQEERMPWVVGRLACSVLDNLGLVALGGGFRSNHLTNSTGVTADVTNYVLALEAKVPLTNEFTVTAEAWTGSGVGAEFVRSGLDYNSLGQEIDAGGGFLSVEWKATDRVSINAGLGIDQPKDADTTAATMFGGSTPFDSNRTIFANIRYQLSKQMGFGVEVMDLHTELIDGAVSGADGQRLRGQRFTAGTWFIF